MSDIATKITTASLTQLIDKLERDLASASIGEYSALTVRADQLDSKMSECALILKQSGSDSSKSTHETTLLDLRVRLKKLRYRMMIIAQRQTPGNNSAPLMFEPEEASRTAHSGTFNNQSLADAESHRRLSQPADVLTAIIPTRISLPSIDTKQPLVKKSLHMTNSLDSAYPIDTLVSSTDMREHSAQRSSFITQEITGKNYFDQGKAESTMETVLKRRRRLYWMLLGIACLAVAAGCVVITIVVHTKRK